MAATGGPRVRLEAKKTGLTIPQAICSFVSM